jgi:hypothetical protein
MDASATHPQSHFAPQRCVALCGVCVCARVACLCTAPGPARYNVQGMDAEDIVVRVAPAHVVKLGDFGTGVVGVKPVCPQSFTTFENTPPELLTDGDAAEHVRVAGWGGGGRGVRARVAPLGACTTPPPKSLGWSAPAALPCPVFERPSEVRVGTCVRRCVAWRHVRVCTLAWCGAGLRPGRVVPGPVRPACPHWRLPLRGAAGGRAVPSAAGRRAGHGVEHKSGRGSSERTVRPRARAATAAAAVGGVGVGWGEVG